MMMMQRKVTFGLKKDFLKMHFQFQMRTQRGIYLHKGGKIYFPRILKARVEIFSTLILS